MTATSSRKYTVLGADDWKCIIELYQTGVNTLSELSARFDVSIRAIQNRARSAGATRRAAFKPAALSAAKAGVAALSPFVAAAPSGKRLTPEQRTVIHEDRIEATNEAAYMGALNLQRLLNMAMAAMPTPTTAAEGAALIRAIDQAAVAQERINKIRRTVLRLDQENQFSDVILPELPIREMSAAEYEALRADQAREDRAHGIAALDRDLDTFVTDEMLTHPPDDRVAEGCEDDQAGGVRAMS